jgi:hypothetical protein
MANTTTAIRAHFAATLRLPTDTPERVFFFTEERQAVLFWKKEPKNFGLFPATPLAPFEQ